LRRTVSRDPQESASAERKTTGKKTKKNELTRPLLSRETRAAASPLSLPPLSPSSLPLSPPLPLSLPLSPLSPSLPLSPPFSSSLSLSLEKEREIKRESERFERFRQGRGRGRVFFFPFFPLSSFGLTLHSTTAFFFFFFFSSKKASSALAAARPLLFLFSPYQSRPTWTRTR